MKEQKGTKREHTFVSRKKQKKRELEKLKVDKNPKVDFKQQRQGLGLRDHRGGLLFRHISLGSWHHLFEGLSTL